VACDQVCGVHVHESCSCFITPSVLVLVRSYVIINERVIVKDKATNKEARRRVTGDRQK
jgi:hypothetical protein